MFSESFNCDMETETNFFSAIGNKCLGSVCTLDEFSFEAFNAARVSLGVFEYIEDAINALCDGQDAKAGANGGTAPLEASEEPPPTPRRDQLETFVQVLFKHAAAGNYVSLRAFVEDRADLKPFKIVPVKLNGNFNDLIDRAYHIAELAANSGQKLVFCPPIATFNDSWRAREQDLAEGLVLSTECDKTAPAARTKLEALLGPATLVVESGDEWTNPKTGEVEPKLHIHHRLTRPSRSKDEHVMLKEARGLAAMLVGADRTNISIVHPIRWPGSLHRKKEPKLCRIVASNLDAEIDLGTALIRLREAVAAKGLSPGGQAAKSNGGKAKVGSSKVSNAFAHLKPTPLGEGIEPRRQYRSNRRSRRAAPGCGMCTTPAALINPSCCGGIACGSACSW